MNLAKLREALYGENIQWERHVLERIISRSISRRAVSQILEDYPNDYPFPSGLFLGWFQDKPLHVVAALDETVPEVYVITATPGTPRPDAVMYCLGALEKFAKMPRTEMQQIAFEIAAKGQSGLDTSDAAPKYQLKSLPGNFSGLHLVCLMYVAFKSIAPDTEMGFDLSKEYAAALTLHSGEKTH